jgi:hypothetical protein
MTFVFPGRQLDSPPKHKITVWQETYKGEAARPREGRYLLGLSHPKKHLFYLLVLFCLSIYATPKPDSILTSSGKSELIKRIGESEKNSRPAEADSLYRVLDRYSALNTEQIYRWVHSRELLGRYAGSVELYCRLLDADSRFGEAVFSRLYQLFENAPPDSTKHSVGAFEKCVLCRSGIDTLGIRFRLANFYAGHGLDSAELNVLTSAAGSPGRLVSRLLDMARERHSGGRYHAAVLPALYVYERTGIAREKTLAAELVYQSYRSLHRDDSALVWITKTDLSKENRKIEATALYQRAGRLPEAKALIGSLSPSFSRDTLTLRQRLYEGDTRSARELAQKARAARPQYPDETLLWSMRTLLFNGDFDDLSALLDTVRPPASWPGAAVLLDCRLMLKRLQNSKEALAVWSHVDYDMFTGKPARALARFSEQRVTPDCRTVLLVRIVKEQLARGDTAAVAPVFREQGGTYLYSEHLLRTGIPDTACKVLLRVIRDYPEGVFSEKSRVLLAKIQSKNK